MHSQWFLRILIPGSVLTKNANKGSLILKKELSPNVTNVTKYTVQNACFPLTVVPVKIMKLTSFKTIFILDNVQTVRPS